MDGSRLVAAAVEFSRVLRDAELGVGLSESSDFVRALSVIDIGDRDEVRAASRAIHVRRHEDILVHDELFDAYRQRAAAGEDVCEDEHGPIMRPPPSRPHEHRAPPYTDFVKVRRATYAANL